MTSLAEVYEENVGEVQSLRRLYLGTGLFVAGVLLAVIAIVVASTDAISGFGPDRFQAWRVAGVLGGLAVPSVMGGVFIVLPTSERIKAAAAIGGSICVLGVGLFWYAYPDHWAGYGRNLTLHVTGVYFFGATTATWCLFTAVANFKTRNDPGGTVTMEVTKKGETRVVEVPRSELESEGLGGVGLFGGTPDGDVETQTNDPGESSPSPAAASTAGATGTNASRSDGAPAGAGSSDRTQSTAGGASGAQRDSPTSTGRTREGGTTTTNPRSESAGAQVSDGGSKGSDISSPMDGNDDAVVIGTESKSQRPTDRYCGNCEHFRYVRTDRGMRPYCGFHDEAMDDMDACDQWTPNS